MKKKLGGFEQYGENRHFTGMSEPVQPYAVNLGPQASSLPVGGKGAVCIVFSRTSMQARCLRTQNASDFHGIVADVAEIYYNCDTLKEFENHFYHLP